MDVDLDVDDARGRTQPPQFAARTVEVDFNAHHSRSKFPSCARHQSRPVRQVSHRDCGDNCIANGTFVKGGSRHQAHYPFGSPASTVSAAHHPPRHRSKEREERRRRDTQLACQTYHRLGSSCSAPTVPPLSRRSSNCACSLSRRGGPPPFNQRGPRGAAPSDWEGKGSRAGHRSFRAQQGRPRWPASIRYGVSLSGLAGRSRRLKW